jgi:hypothetical protein
VCARQSSASSQSLAIFSPRLAGVTVVLILLQLACSVAYLADRLYWLALRHQSPGRIAETGDWADVAFPSHHSVAELLDFSFALVHLQTADCVPSRPSTRPTLSVALSIATPAPIRALLSFVRSFFRCRAALTSPAAALHLSCVAR